MTPHLELAFIASETKVMNRWHGVEKLFQGKYHKSYYMFTNPASGSRANPAGPFIRGDPMSVML